MTISLKSATDLHLDEQLEAFRGFMDALTVPNPRQLVLIQPQLIPEQLFDLPTARNRGYHAYPPMGLLYVAAVAKEVNPELEVKVIDLNYEILRHSQSEQFDYRIWEQQLYDAIESCDAPHIGVTCMFGTTKQNFVEVSRFIRENFPAAPILSGGVQATYDYQELLETGLCDIVFRNEGELQIKSFLERCGNPNSDVYPSGSAFRWQEQVYELGTQHEDVPMDWDLRPHYPLVNVQDYNDYGSLAAFSRMVGDDKKFATILSNRGCRARCTFCTVRDFNGFGVRQRSVESVVDEIKFLVQEKGVQQIDWLDDDLLWNPKRAVELFQRMAEEVPDLEWTSSNGLIAAAISEEIMYWMAESGLQAFKIGIESGNQRMLHLIKKPTTMPKLRDKRELFKQYPDVFVCANFIVGFPNETFGEMMDSFNFASELKWDWAQYNICQPLKGTDMFSVFQELGDDRCFDETFSKSLNPARSSQRGEFERNQDLEETGIKSGMDVFNLPYDLVPNSEQLREIWLAFNLVTNFLNNLNFGPGGNPTKLVRWLEAIHSGYAYDAAMSAALVRGHKLLGNQERMTFYQNKFESILGESAYWRQRVVEFPGLIELAEVSGQVGDFSDSHGSVPGREYPKDAL